MHTPLRPGQAMLAPCMGPYATGPYSTGNVRLERHSPPVRMIQFPGLP
jgi:hypothetical protein